MEVQDDDRIQALFEKKLSNNKGRENIIRNVKKQK